MKEQFKWIAVLGLAAVMSVSDVCAQARGSTAAQPTGRVITKNGGALEGVIRYRTVAKSYTITQRAQGGSTMDMDVKLDDVERISIQKPANFDSAVQRVKAGQASAAVNDLQGIIRNYTMLQWDVDATRWLAEAYLQMNQAAEAVRVCEALHRNRPETAYLGDVAVVYWRALLKDGKSVQLDRYLDRAIASGDLEAGAYALILRGDKIMDKGTSADNCYAALRDGYLRVILLYRNATEAVPEALSKAAKAFDGMQRGQDAQKLREDLRKNYPNSEWNRR